MKIQIQFLALIALVMAAARLPAQTLQTLYSFNGGTDGEFPYGGLTLGSDGNFYGTTTTGGSNINTHFTDGMGTVFKVTTNGTLITLVSFNYTNGAEPWAALTLGADGNFYGTTTWGGNTNLINNNGGGTVFKVTTNGILTTLVCFNITNGFNPGSALTLGADGNFYGTTQNGGTNGNGTVFRMTTNGLLTTLITFNFTIGEDPSALTLGTDGNFYGTTAVGGNTNLAGGFGYGTVFKVTTNGTLTTLASFDYTNGAYPNALTLGNDGNFYGTAGGGGNTNFDDDSGEGTVFKVTTNGTLTTLVSFNYTNGIGISPQAALTFGSDGNFYGMTRYGGNTNLNEGYGVGTVFKVTTNGTLTLMAVFNGNNGMSALGALTLGSDGNFYGTTGYGGNTNLDGGYGWGTVFRLLMTNSPIIISQPQPLTVTNGNPAIFVSAATGSPSLAYQWFFNGSNLPGATNTTLALQNAFSANAGAYTVVVTNAFGCATSNPAMLTVLPLGIAAPMMLASGQFQFSFDTVTGVNYAVQCSTNLTQWFPWVTLGGLGVPLTLIDPNTAGSQQRFYRIILSAQ